MIYKDARLIYEADREGYVAAAGDNFEFALRIYEDARMKHNAAIKEEGTARNAAAKAARAIYETGREKKISVWENYRAALQVYENARMKLNATYKAQKAARRAVQDAVSEATSAAKNAVKKANPSQD